MRIKNISIRLSALLLAVLTVCGTLPLSAASDTEYDGKGTVIAIIDNGFDCTSEYFRLTETKSAVIKKDTADKLGDALNGKGKFVSPKLPFVYDYSDNDTDVKPYDDHGTHLAGIIGANSTSFKGAAPEAQLLLMKVFGSSKGTASEDAIIAALKDAVTLGADVICLCVGIPVGFADGTPFGEDYTAALDAAEAAGITVVTSAGNNGRIGAGSRYFDDYGIPYPAAYLPDIGTIAVPGTMATLLTAGALVPDTEKQLTVTVKYSTAEAPDPDKSEEIKLRITDSSYTYVEPIGKNMTDRFDGQTIEYVSVGGMGRPEDYDALETSVEGKIVLIERGEISFVEKLNNAAERGAVAAIVYDNEFSDEYPLMQLEGSMIPGVLVNRNDGLKLVANTDKRVVCIKGDTGDFESPYAGEPAAYSSWGVTPELTLKPDLCAVGHYESTVAGGKLGIMHGTSQAAAYIAGVTALWYQHLYAKGLEKAADFDAAYVRTLMMNAAFPGVGGESEVEYSPRVQGAGKLTAEDTGSVQLLITTDNGSPKAELYDKLAQSFDIPFTVTNITENEVSAEISASLLTERTAVYAMDEKGKVSETVNLEEKSDELPFFLTGEMLALEAPLTIGDTDINRWNDGTPYAVTLGAGESIELTLNVDYGDELYNELMSRCENGWFAEGYIYAATTEGASSMPYMGFTGDWATLPLFDGTQYGGEMFYGNAKLYTDVTTYAGSSYTVTLGQNIYAGKEAPLYTDRIAFSPDDNGMSDTVELVLDTLRSAKDAEYTVYDKDGNEVFASGKRDYLRKNYVTETGELTYSDFTMWGGRDELNASYVYPDGTYRMVFKAVPAYEGAKPQYLEFDIIIDTEMPKLLSYEFVTEGEKTLLKLTAGDNNMLMGVSVYGSVGGEISKELDLDSEITDPAIGKKHELTFDVTGFEKRYIYVDVIDYAFNLMTERLTNPNYAESEE